MTSRGGTTGAQLFNTLALLLALPLAASFAFMAVEGWSFFDALYMSVITLTTVGYSEVHPLSTGGRIVVIVYLVCGLGAFLFGIAQVGEALIRVQVGELLSRRKMDTTIRTLSDHIVVCGYGRMGQNLCRHLAPTRRVVVIDRDPEALDQARVADHLVVEGDATDDAILRAAGIERASGLAAVLAGDADNLFVVLSARMLRRDLQILARATDEKSVSKLERAGANRVISLYETGANRMARLLTNPHLEDFMQILTAHGEPLDLAEISVTAEASFCRQRLRDTDFRQRGVLIVGHQKPTGPLAVPPPSDALIEDGDTLFAFGTADSIGAVLADG